MIAGKKAGASTVLLANGEKPPMAPENPKPDYVCGNLDEAVEIVLRAITSF